MYDLLIHAGTIVDGSGEPPFIGDVAVENGRIVAVGRVDGAARRTLDADGLLVAPGFVDIHTHYDGQATWDPLLTPSCWHGVTTAVMGNCGVGFAPMKSERRQFLIELMEGVEDIPGPCSPRASTGAGRASPSISTRSKQSRALWISAPSCRTRRCATT